MRQLPQSPDAERAVLGALLMYPSSQEIVREYDLLPEDFFLPAHKILFDAMRVLMDQGKAIDIPALMARLVDLDQLRQIGGGDYLVDLTTMSASPANTKYYVETILDKAHLRQLIETAQQIEALGFDARQEVNEILDEAEKQILGITRSRRSEAMRDSRDVVRALLDHIRMISEHKTRVTGIPTGFRQLDRVTAGLQKGDLIVLAARPSVGKTAFALNLALNSALGRDKAHVALFSLEMPSEHLMERMLASKSGVNANHIKTGYLTDMQWNALSEASALLREAPIYFDDSGSITLADIASKCRRLAVEQGLDLIIIDYIQLITGARRNNDNRQQEVSDISRGLKQLARELKVPVIALSQLSRLVERREGNKPVLADLRESGAIEQDADIVMFLYRENSDPANKDETNDQPQMVKLNIAKHRNGSLADLEFQFKGQVFTFYAIEGQKTE